MAGRVAGIQQLVIQDIRGEEQTKRIDRLWKEYFRDPSPWIDDRILKSSASSPDFREKNTLECLWIDGFFNPCWVRQELSNRKIILSLAVDDRRESNGSYKDSFAFVSLLKDCAERKDLCAGTRIHGEIIKGGLLEKSPYLATTLITMYARCGKLDKAHTVLQELPFRNIVAANALISGYVQHGRCHEALCFYEKMQKDGLSPDSISYICILKACGSLGAIDKGKQIHYEIMNRDMLEQDVVLGTSLMNMYAKCGMLLEAQKVLEGLPVRNVISWNTLIAGYAQEDQCTKVFNCYEQMQSEGLSPDVVTFICILRACGSTGAIDKGREIHEKIVSSGMIEKDIVLGTALVDMYAKCGRLEKAHEVLKSLPVRDVVSWSALITGYSREGHGHEALNCFEEMQKEGLPPDVVTFICILNACGSTGAIEKGKWIHEKIVKEGFLEKDIMLGNALVDMYVKCGFLVKAHQVLKELPSRDVVSWSALISGYAQSGQGQEALHCFEQMQSEHVSPDSVTFICALNACSSIGAIDKGKEIHNEIKSRGLLGKDVMLGNALVDMYAKCGCLGKAQEVIEELPIRDVVSWSALISGYAQQGQCCKALDCYERMQNEGLFPDEVTFICILKACGSTGDLNKGRQIHRDIVNRNLLEKDIVLGTALVDMYAKCGLLAKAQEVLRELPVRDVIPWNALITGYAQQGQVNQALKCFHSMQDEGISPNVVTFICVLKACGSTGAIEDGERIHVEILRMGLLGKEIMLGNALVDMYAKCGFPGKAQKVLEELHVRDIVSWNALIAGHAELGQCSEALGCFERMQNDDDLCPDAVTFICILKACGNAGALDKGKMIHEEIVSRGLLGKNIELGNALVDMYAKCGAIALAQEVLEELPIRDVVTWNALIAGCAEKGLGYEALSCFRKIKSESLVPDEITLLCVLSACCHSGLSEEAEVIFGEMNQKYGIAPTLEHHTCMVVAYGYAGRFEKAMEVISVMPSSDYPTVWIALLSACRKWENAGLGRLAFDQAVQLDASCAVAYILMANIFASNGMKEDAERIEAMRLKYAPWPDNRGKASSIGGCEDVHAFSTEFMNAKVKKPSLLRSITCSKYAMQ